MNPPPLSPSFFRNARRQAGFSLVEVVLAVGVVAFAFVAILGLIPAGMTQFRQAIDTSVCAQIGQRVILDAQQSDFDVLIDREHLQTASDGQGKDFYTFRGPTVSSPAFRYFDEQGNEVVFTTASPTAGDLTKKGVIYHVNTRIGVTTDIPAKGYTGRKNADVATVTVEVAFNPSNQTLAITSGSADDQQTVRRNLILSKPNVPVKTYSSQVGRNQ